MSAPLLIGEGLVTRSVQVAKQDVAWLRYLLEAEDNLGFLHGDAEGNITLVTTADQEDDLDAFLASTEVGSRNRR